MDEKKKVELFKSIKKVMDENNIEFFPTGGTLLGLLRDKKILPWDADLDFGMWYIDYDKLVALKSEFEKLGYNVFYAKGKYQHYSICYPEDFEYYTDREKYELTHGTDVPFHGSFSFWTKDVDHAIQLRFFDNNLFDRLFGKIGNRIQNIHLLKCYNFLRRFYCALILYTKKLYVYPLSWFKKLDTLKAYGLDIKILSEPVKYCELMYGPNWRTPEKGWNREKHLKNTQFLIKYNIKDKKNRDLWLRRGEKMVHN